MQRLRVGSTLWHFVGGSHKKSFCWPWKETEAFRSWLKGLGWGFWARKLPVCFSFLLLLKETGLCVHFCGKKTRLHQEYTTNSVSTTPYPNRYQPTRPWTLAFCLAKGTTLPFKVCQRSQGCGCSSDVKPGAKYVASASVEDIGHGQPSWLTTELRIGSQIFA